MSVDTTETRTVEVTTDPRGFVRDYRRLVDLGLAGGPDVAFVISEVAWMAACTACPEDGVDRHVLFIDLLAVGGVDFVLVDPYDEEPEQ